MQEKKFEELRSHVDELVAQKALTFDIVVFILNSLIDKHVIQEKEVVDFLNNNTNRYYGKISENGYKVISQITELLKSEISH